MTTLPLWTWVIGAIILGAVLLYGILRNRTRTRQERIISNEATKELYRQEINQTEHTTAYGQSPADFAIYEGLFVV